MRMLDQRDILYEVVEFELGPNAATVAEFAGVPVNQLYKTLVVVQDDPQARPMLIMIGADRELNLRLVAQTLGVKKVQMAKHAEAERLTGLQTGGISAITLHNKRFDIYIDQQVTEIERVAVSAGERGLDVLLNVDDLIDITGASLIEATSPPEH